MRDVARGNLRPGRGVDAWRREEGPWTAVRALIRRSLASPRERRRELSSKSLELTTRIDRPYDGPNVDGAALERIPDLPREEMHVKMGNAVAVNLVIQLDGLRRRGQGG